jgi:hypothetical protein
MADDVRPCPRLYDFVPRFAKSRRADDPSSHARCGSTSIEVNAIYVDTTTCPEIGVNMDIWVGRERPRPDGLPLTLVAPAPWTIQVPALFRLRTEGST